MIELYGCGSPNVRKVVILLEELRLAFQIRRIDILRGEGQSPEFLALNPLGRVPVLIDRNGPAAGEPIFESAAILVYLAETYSGHAFLPSAGADRYATLKWLMLQIASIGPTFGQHNHFTITGADKESYAAVRFREQSHRLYRILDTRLASNAWLAADRYTIADVATYPWAVYVENHRFDWADFPHLAEWRSRIEARPAVQMARTHMQNLIESDTASSHQATPAQLSALFWMGGKDVPGVDFARLYPQGRTGNMYMRESETRQG